MASDKSNAVLSQLSLARRAARLPLPAHAEGGNAISLDSGYASPDILPDFTQAALRALNTFRSESLQYGSPLGLYPLREWIAEYMREDGSDVSSDEIMVVGGAKQGLDLICRLLVDEGDAVVVTGPTYFTAIPILRSFGLEFIEIPQDAEGLDVEILAERLAQRERRGRKPPKFIYDVPDFHNPAGITMSSERRASLIALANAKSIPVVEDSPYRKLRFEGVSKPSLKALDRDGMVFALGTFSKLLAPGLRIGWVCAERALLGRMARLKSDGGTCPLTQRTILEFFKDGGLAPQLERARNAYKTHRDLMIAALRRELPQVSFAVPEGGYYLWLRFPEGADTDVVAERAYAAGVSVIAGNVFFAADDPESAKSRGIPRRYMRIAYSRANAQEIEAGVHLLAGAYNSIE